MTWEIVNAAMTRRMLLVLKFFSPDMSGLQKPARLVEDGPAFAGSNAEIEGRDHAIHDADDSEGL
jgi:hypothetical protein